MQTARLVCSVVRGIILFRVRRVVRHALPDSRPLRVLKLPALVTRLVREPGGLNSRPRHRTVAQPVSVLRDIKETVLRAINVQRVLIT
jgi:hypothetical protein